MPVGVPVVDLAPSRHRVATERVARACSEWGFFQVVGHPLTPSFPAQVWEGTHAFFALPRAAKLDLLRTKRNPRGHYHQELTKNRRNLKEVFDFGRDGVAAGDDVNQWPVSRPGATPRDVRCTSEPVSDLRLTSWRFSPRRLSARPRR